MPELRSSIPQARAQALHTLSKLGDSRAWPAITTELLQDPEDEVARTAWRAAATLVPTDDAAAVAEVLATQFNRGDRAFQRSPTRALAGTGRRVRRSRPARQASPRRGSPDMPLPPSV